MDDTSRPHRLDGIDRRSFLRGTAAGIGLGLVPLAARAEDGGPRVRRQVTLGRTGLAVPDIGFGSSRLREEPELVRHALSRGITYFDTAESYTGGTSEEVLGRALEGVRQDVVLVSKGKHGARDSVEEMMERLEGSLRRLRTDYVDVYFNHAVNDPARMTNPAWGEFCERAKEQGKIRWRGMSGHGGRLVECIDASLEQDNVDVLLVGYNFGQDPSFMQRFTSRLDFVAVQPELPGALERAHAKGVGVVAMKTLRGGRLNDLRPYEAGGATFAQAAFRWTLSNPNVSSLVVTMRSTEEIDEYLVASGWSRPRAGDLGLLARYEDRNGASQCRYGCGDCASACPAGVPIDEVLRARMYDRDYGDPALGREEYARLGAPASACAACPAPCAGACPHGVTIPELVRDAARRLG